MESPASSGSDFEAVSSHLHRLQVSHDLLQQRVLHLEERLRALEDERPSVLARLSWLEQNPAAAAPVLSVTFSLRPSCFSGGVCAEGHVEL